MTARQIEIVPFTEEHRAGCVVVLARLPHWFGFEQSNREYLASLGRLPAYVALVEGAVSGFVSLEVQTEAAAEIIVLAVSPDLHRQGAGRALLGRAEQHLRDAGLTYVHLKTLGPSDPDEGYALTRAFYAALGYLPLFETTAFWGDEQPTLVLIKRL